MCSTSADMVFSILSSPALPSLESSSRERFCFCRNRRVSVFRRLRWESDDDMSSLEVRSALRKLSFRLCCFGSYVCADVLMSGDCRQMLCHRWMCGLLCGSCHFGFVVLATKSSKVGVESSSCGSMPIVSANNCAALPPHSSIQRPSDRRSS